MIHCGDTNDLFAWIALIRGWKKEWVDRSLDEKHRNYIFKDWPEKRIDGMNLRIHSQENGTRSVESS